VRGQYVYFSTATLDQPLALVEVSVWAAECAICPSNSQSMSGSTQRIDCKCDEGFSGPDGGPCQACEQGTFKNTIGSAACSICAANTNSLSQNTRAHLCTCNPGFRALLPTSNATCTEVVSFLGEYEQAPFNCVDRTLSAASNCYDPSV